jgi:DNA-binding HxlR family transcriptional regulator
VGKRAVARSAHTERHGAVPQRGAGLAAVRGGQASRSSLELDRMIHERVRLAIVSALAVNESLTFNELKQLLGTSDGNLSVHARRLEDAGYVECLKSFAGRLPRTEFRLTPLGRDALERYLSHMEGLISSTRSGS